ncbi:G-protein-signaling modulator 1-like, partial [Orbicella faveolata]|uniref:G-protein-signaling modulator 1-like n=1 Tax=Orbicella faveolata TaxID=48498 RepID=UPI0009E2914D
MNNIYDILHAVVIGLVVATFLLNTGRAQKGIKVCKECLIFLNNKGLKAEGEIFHSLHIGIYGTIFRAYCLIPDHTKALIYGRKLLHIYRECGKKEEEGNLMVKLANIYQQQYKYLEARELYEKAIPITKEMRDKKNEAYVDEMIGVISYHLGDYDKAKGYLKKALAIRLQFGDKNGEASSYGNLGT